MSKVDRSKFLDRHGWLTAYALACGYCHRESVGKDDTIDVCLWMEHSVFHVRVYDHRKYIRISWEVTKSLLEARTFYNNALRLHRSPK